MPSKVCLVSGGSSGIGLATAIRFAREGYRVSICGRDGDKLTAAGKQICEHTDVENVFMARTQLQDAASCKEWVAQSLAKFERIDVLVNNAAAAYVSPVDEMSEEQFEATIDLNVRAVFYATQTAWKTMKEQGSGLIVNISSLAAIDPFEGFSVYGATKSWLELFSKAIAAEGKPLGIRSYVVRPGVVETPLLRGLFPDFPADQCVSPSEVAELVWRVCQAEFQNSSGAVIPVTRQ